MLVTRSSVCGQVWSFNGGDGYGGADDDANDGDDDDDDDGDDSDDDARTKKSALQKFSI